ncbi:hypothetical protein DYH09_03920 [bacterium CPR1]|nr:hypothetical protein [bacterium CPR1]
MKSNQPPGISDIRLLNFCLALSFWLAVAGWLALFHFLTPGAASTLLVEKREPSLVVAFWVSSLNYTKASIAVGAALLLALGWLLVGYLRKASLRQGWVLPLLIALVHLAGVAALLHLLVPVLLR